MYIAVIITKFESFNSGEMFKLMGFKEDLQKLAVQIGERKEHVTNEEMAKQSLIIPFLQVLGFDVFNPLEIRPEYDSDFGRKKGEKVDYAISKDGKPIMFIEAKPISEKLDNHCNQLSRYFNATPEVKVGIITNGIEYKFFTDLDKSNIMDDAPFFQANMTNLSESDIDTLTSFRKESFDTQATVAMAEELIYTSNLNQKLEDIFKNPPDEFIRYLIKDLSDTKITANVLEKFRPIVKKSISQALLKMVTQSLVSHVAPTIETTIQTEELPVDVEKDESVKKAVAITTDDELKSFDLVKAILDENGKDSSLISFKDTTAYFSIFTRNPSNWIVRLNLSGNKKGVITNLPLNKVKDLVTDYEVDTPSKGVGISRVCINKVEDISKLTNLIIACFNDVVRE